jgi:hypothetical protein
MGAADNNKIIGTNRFAEWYTRLSSTINGHLGFDEISLGLKESRPDAGRNDAIGDSVWEQSYKLLKLGCNKQEKPTG